MKRPKKNYKDHFHIVTNGRVTHKGAKHADKMTLKLRQFDDGRCCLYMHVGVTLVARDEAPVADLDRLERIASEIRAKYTGGWTNA